MTKKNAPRQGAKKMMTNKNAPRVGAKKIVTKKIAPHVRIQSRIVVAALTVIVSTACNSNKSAGKEKEMASGETLFLQKCAQCHKPAEDFVGPSLKDVRKRWEKNNLLYEFIRNPQQVIATDPYSKELFLKWRQAYMQPNPDLTNAEIDRILDYCDSAK